MLRKRADEVDAKFMNEMGEVGDRGNGLVRKKWAVLGITTGVCLSWTNCAAWSMAAVTAKRGGDRGLFPLPYADLLVA